MKSVCLFFLLLLSSFLTACLYDPEPYSGSASTADSSITDFGVVYPVNDNHQICNPSVSEDTLHYPASMLWLNFSGNLTVKNPPEGYATTKAVQHDRLTVSDTAGKVLWFVMRDSVPGVKCQFQDPEWSTHANFIVTLGGFPLNGKSCDDLDHGILVLRLSDKASFWLLDSAVSELATPHLWVGEASAAIDSTDSLQAFFETDQVQLVYVSADNKILWVDYAQSSKATALQKPLDRKDWMMDSPLISPDGKWVIYNVLNGSYEWESYIQELSATSIPVKIPLSDDMLSEPAQPHWWRYGDRLFVIWAEFSAGSSMLNKADFTVTAAQDGSLGRTSMREVSLTPGAPADMAVEWIGDVRVLAPLPFTGGRSPDGYFMATGTNNGYLLNLP